MTPEQLGYVMSRLMEAGALDVYFTSIFMKKNRPAVKLTVLAKPDKKEGLTAVLFKETTTFGIRFTQMNRDILSREMITLETPKGPIRCKLGRFEGKIIRQAPEYEDCRKIAEATGLPLVEIYREAVKYAEDKVRKIQ